MGWKDFSLSTNTGVQGKLKNALGLGKGPKGSFTSGQDLVKQQDLLNRYNINTAFGSRNFTTDPATGRSVLNIEESPFQKALRGLQEQQALGIYNQKAPSAADFAQQGEDIRNALYETSLYNLRPEFQSQDTATADYLSNRGLSPNSEAYRSALRDLRRDRGNQLNQLGLQATLAGTGEQDRLVRLAELQRAARLAETGSATQGIDLGLFGNVAGIDAAGIISGQEAAQNAYNLSRFQDTQKRRSAALTEGIKGGASLFSDVRLKEDVKLVGKENGINIYEFKYKGKPERYRGVMAQEVREVIPEAVIEKDGFLAVDYDKIGIEFKEV